MYKRQVLVRVEKMGDLFEPVQKLKQKLPQLAGLVAESEKEKEEGEGSSIAAPAEGSPRPKKKKTMKPKGKSPASKRRKL